MNYFTTIDLITIGKLNAEKLEEAMEYGEDYNLEVREIEFMNSNGTCTVKYLGRRDDIENFEEMHNG